MRKLSLIAAALALAACTESTDEMPVGPIDDITAEFAFGPGGAARYRVTVYNLTGGQPFTPPVAATHGQPVSVFTVGTPASVEIQEIAENGNNAPMVAALGADPHVSAVGGGSGAIFPGASDSFYIDSNGGAKWFSLAMMLICTNDGFTGVDSQRLPKRVGESVTLWKDGYDAGTEVNTEAWADIVPPCAMITGFGDQGGTGTTDPSLAEDDVIRRHPNIVGDDDLQIDPHRWADPVAKIVIERVE